MGTRPLRRTPAPRSALGARPLERAAQRQLGLDRRALALSPSGEGARRRRLESIVIHVRCGDPTMTHPSRFLTRTAAILLLLGAAGAAAQTLPPPAPVIPTPHVEV